MRTNSRFPGYVRILVFLCAMTPPAALAFAQTFTATGTMTEARFAQTATLLPTGEVLVIGGDALGSAELYDPASGTFSPTGSMNVARFGHTATLLQDGKVLVRGGTIACVPPTPAEIYDPATGVFTETTSSTLKCDTLHATATLLANGKVLIVGGQSQIGPFSAAELYDPATNTFTATGSLTDGYFPYYHTATLLGTGKVLIAGGDNWFDGSGNTYAIAELYDTASGTFSNSIPMVASRAAHSATLLGNGKVLMAGGYFEGCCGLAYGDRGVHGVNELFDPATSKFSGTGALNGARYSHTATLLSGGQVLIAGGTDLMTTAGTQSGGPTATAELYDPASGVFSFTGSMNTARDTHAATLLNSGAVLVTGGQDASGNPLASAELYSPPAGSTTPGQAHASPLTISFGRHKLGTTSAARIAVIANPLVNAAPLVIGSLSLATTQFMIDPAKTTCVSGISIPRGKSCRVGVRFIPTVAGVQTDTLVVNDNSTNGPHQIQLKGTGM